MRSLIPIKSEQNRKLSLRNKKKTCFNVFKKTKSNYWCVSNRLLETDVTHTMHTHYLLCNYNLWVEAVRVLCVCVCIIDSVDVPTKPLPSRN